MGIRRRLNIQEGLRIEGRECRKTCGSGGVSVGGRECGGVRVVGREDGRT